MTNTLEQRAEVTLAPLELMLAELESNQLFVVLAPQKRHTNEGGCIRVAASKNCEWYRKFCFRHSSSRRRRNALHDTKIKRRDTIRLLERMIAGKPVRSIYELELRQIARKNFS